MLRKKISILLFCIFTCAFTIDEKLANRDHEQRACELFKNIKCLVCTGETIYDSQAEFAKQMRVMIRRQIMQGKSDREITAYLQDKYGKEILLEPPFYRSTYLLWFLPIGVFIITCMVIANYLLHLTKKK